MANELSLPPAQTDPALQQAAQTQVGGEIAQELAPLDAEIGSLEGRSGAAVQDIDRLFSTLQPSVEASAARVGEFNKGLLAMEKDIFGAATDRISAFRQARAAEAQALAQQIGGPVPISEFTYGADVEMQLAPQDFAGSMLRSMGYAQAGVGEAEAFAGKVFPLIRKEETLRTQRYFADQITKLRKEIAAIKASKAGRVSERFTELRLAEREYRLQRFQAMQSAMETKQALAQRKQELKADRERLALERAQLLGYTWRKVRVKGKDGKWKNKMVKVPTLAARELGQQKEQFGRTLRLDAKTKNREYQLALAEQRAAQKELGVERASSAMELLNEAMDDTGKGPETYTQTTQHVLADKSFSTAQWGKTKKQALLHANKMLSDMKFDGEVPKDATVDVKLVNGQWQVKVWVLKDVKTAVPGTAGKNLTNPNQAVDYLTAAGYSKALAIRTVRARFGLPKSWKYGDKAP